MILLFRIQFKEFVVVVFGKKILWPHSVEMGTIHFQEVDELFVLGQQDFEDVLCVSMGGSLLHSFGRCLTRWFLSREVLDEAEDMVTVLSDHISRECLDGAIHGMGEPSGDELAVTL